MDFLVLHLAEPELDDVQDFAGVDALIGLIGDLVGMSRNVGDSDVDLVAFGVGMSDCVHDIDDEGLEVLEHVGLQLGAHLLWMDFDCVFVEHSDCLAQLIHLFRKGIYHSDNRWYIV